MSFILRSIAIGISALIKRLEDRKAQAYQRWTTEDLMNPNSVDWIISYSETIDEHIANLETAFAAIARTAKLIR